MGKGKGDEEKTNTGTEEEAVKETWTLLEDELDPAKHAGKAKKVLLNRFWNRIFRPLVTKLSHEMPVHEAKNKAATTATSARNAYKKRFEGKFADRVGGSNVRAS